VVFDVADPARVAAAIHAGVALSTAEGKDGMIKYVVSVKAKLRFVAFSYVKGLRKCQIRVEPSRTTVRIPSDIADLAASRQRKRPGFRPRQRASVQTGQVGIRKDVRRLAQSACRQRREPQQVAGGISARSRFKSARCVGAARP